VVAVEEVAWPWGRTSLRTVGLLGRARAIGDALAVVTGARQVPVAVGTARRLVVGRGDAPKEEVERALLARHHSLARHLAEVPAGQRHHVADAAAVVVAAAALLRERTERTSAACE
jgi:Holliday junction resolvasome RuvABC endonuclease subunit